MKGRGTARQTGGSQPTADFARQASREGFKLDDEILTVFERFEVIWPLHVADLFRQIHGLTWRGSGESSWTQLNRNQR